MHLGPLRGTTTAVVFVLLLAACGSATPATSSEAEEPDPASSQGQSGPPSEAQFEWGSFQLADHIAEKLAADEELVIRYVNFYVSAPFFEPTRQGLADASKEFGVDATMVGATDGSIEETAAEIETQMTTGVDGLIVVCPSADVLAPLIDRAIEAGIPTVTSNIDCPGSKRFAYYGQDLVASGVAAGEEFMRYFRERYPEGDAGEYKVALFAAAPEADYARDRFEGFQSVVGENADIEFVGPFEATAQPDDAYAAVENAFNADPDIVGIYMTDESILGGGTYIDRNDLHDDVIAVGFNFNEGIPQLIQAGALRASIGQYPYDQGYEPVRALVGFLRDGEVPDCDVCDVGAEVLNTENVDEWLEAN